MWLFGEKMKLLCAAAVTQAHCRRRLILNLFTKPDVCMPSVNNITAREALPESLQFGRAVPRILQEVWVEDQAQGPVRVSKLDVIYAYHHSTVTPSQVGEFSYVVPLASGHES